MKNDVFFHQCLRFLSIICFLFLFTPSCFASNSEINVSHSTLLACYFVGNDIESDNRLGDWGFITQNLLDLREGYGEGRPGELFVIIAYGGADKEGWQGMRVYSLKNATADFLDNGMYDRWDTYTLSYPGCNMGSKDSFLQFLELLKPYRNADRKYLIMSGHGGAYKGAFPDENFDTGNIPLSDMRDALSESGLFFDIIGMDTCLMGTLEVAHSLYSHADYLLASEETEPSRGWNYTILARELVHDPSILPEDLGRSIIDSYADFQLSDRPGTLTLIDLNKIPAVIESLDLFSQKVSEVYKDPVYKKKVQQIVTGSGEFGLEFYMSLETDKRLFVSYTMDLISFAQDMKNAIPELDNEAKNLIDSVHEAVVYHVEQKRPYATGLSIFTPLHKEAILEHIFEYSPSLAVSEEWYSLLIQFFRSVLSDKQKPVFIESGEGVHVNDESYTDVELEFVRKTSEFEVLLGVEPAYARPSGDYVLLDWDGNAFHLKNVKTGRIQIIPVFFQRTIDPETEEYYAFARISKEDDPAEPWVCIDVFFNNRTGKTSLFFIYLGEDEENILDIAHSGRLFSLSDMEGIGIIPYATILYQNGKRTWMPVSDTPFLLQGDIVSSYEKVACGEYYYYLVATDVNGNRVAGPKKKMNVPC